MLEPANQQYVQIGRVAQAHGVDGTILLIPEYNRPKLFKNRVLVRLQNSRGDLVPARIESVRVQQKKNRLSFFIKFDHIMDRNDAERLRGWPVFVDRDAFSFSTDKHTAASLQSFTVVDDAGQHVGEVKEIIHNAAQLLLSVQMSDDSSLLIPFVDEYVRQVDEEDEIIYCHNLYQLSDL